MNLSLINTIYYKIFIVGFGLFLLEKTKQFKSLSKLFPCFFAVVLIFFAGFRWKIGTDWDNYYSFFKSIVWNNMTSKIFQHFDYGYRFFNVFIKIFTDSYTIFLTLLSAVAIFLIYRSLKVINADIMLGLAVFYANYFLAFYLGSNRMILAIGFVLLGMTAIFYGEKRKAFLLGLIGFLMHKASVFYWLTFYVPKKIMNFYKLVFFFALSMITGYKQITVKILRFIIRLTKSIHYFGISSFAATGQMYIENKQEDLGQMHFLLASVKRIIVCLFIFSIYKWFAKRKSDKFEYFFNIYALSIGIYFCFNGLGVFQVFSTYLAVTETVVWGTLYNNVRMDKRLMLIVIIFVLYTMELLSSFPVYLDLYIPYKTIWG